MINLLKNWLLAIRPKTLTAAVSPVMIGTAMAYGDGVHHFPTAVWCLLGALAIQIGTNLSNDYFDFEKGADTEERVGPVRVTQAGLIKPHIMRLGFIIAFGLAGYVCVQLLDRGGIPIAIIGILSIFSGILYTAGPRPLGYLGLGDIFVFIFFGPVAVGGTYYVQSLEMNYAVILAGLAPGLFSAGILTINNLRDIESDQRCGKLTLAARFGKNFARCEYFFVIVLASLMPIFIYYLIEDHLPILFSSWIILFAIPTIYRVLIHEDGPSLNVALAQTGILLLIYSAVFSIGWVL